MADMDGFKEAANFGFGEKATYDTFHVKGANSQS